MEHEIKLTDVSERHSIDSFVWWQHWCL